MAGLLTLVLAGTAPLWSGPVAGTAADTVGGVFCRIGSLFTGGACIDGDAPAGKPGDASGTNPGGERPAPPSDEDYKPERCYRSTAGGETKTGGKVAFVKVSRKTSFLRQNSSDGEVRYTLVPGEYSAGLEFGVGGGLKLGKNFKLGADLTLTPVSGSYGVGDTWVFDNAEQAAEFERRVAQGTDGLPDPQITTTTVGISSGVTGALGVKVPLATGKDFDLGPNLSGGGEVSDEVAVVHDDSKPDDPSYPRSSYVFTSTGEVQVEGSLRGVKGGVKRKWSHLVKITKDRDGRIVGYTEITTAEGQGSVGGGPSRSRGSCSSARRPSRTTSTGSTPNWGSPIGPRR